MLLKAVLRTLSSLHCEHFARNSEFGLQHMRRRYTRADLPATYLDFDFPGLDKTSRLVIDQRELAWRERKRHGLCLAGFQMNPLKALERSDRDRRRSRHVSDVKFHHFIAGNFSGISDCD